jgi:hypothetical protein
MRTVLHIISNACPKNGIASGVNPAIWFIGYEDIQELIEDACAGFEVKTGIVNSLE